MITKKVKLSCGEAELRGLKNKEEIALEVGIQNIKTECANAVKMGVEKGGIPKEDYDIQVSFRVTDLTYRIFAGCIVSHTFDLKGKSLMEFIEDMSREDVDKLFDPLTPKKKSKREKKKRKKQ